MSKTILVLLKLENQLEEVEGLEDSSDTELELPSKVVPESEPQLLVRGFSKSLKEKQGFSPYGTEEEIRMD